MYLGSDTIEQEGCDGSMTVSVGAWCAVVLATIFGIAAITKLGSRAGINVAVRRLLPARVAPWSRELALALVLAELAVGVGCVGSMFAPGVRPFTLVAAASFALGFTVLSVASATGLRAVDCACFGGSPRPLGWLDVVRDLVLLGVAIVGVVPALAGWSLSGVVLLPAGLVGVWLIAFVVVRQHGHARPPAEAEEARRASRPVTHHIVERTGQS